MPALTSLPASFSSSSSSSYPSHKPHAIAWLQRINLVSSSTSTSTSTSSSSSSHLSSPHSFWTLATVCLLVLGAVRLYSYSRRSQVKNSLASTTKTQTASIASSDSKQELVSSPSTPHSKASYAHHLAPSLPSLPSLPAKPDHTTAKTLDHYSVSQSFSQSFSQSCPLPPSRFTRSRRIYQLGQPLQPQLYSQSQQSQQSQHLQHPQLSQLYQHAMRESRGISSVSADSPARSSSPSPSLSRRSTPPLVNVANANANLFYDNSLPPLPLSTSSLNRSTHTNATAGPYNMAPAPPSETTAMQSMSFIHQPNPDYGADTETEAEAESAESAEPAGSETETGTTEAATASTTASATPTETAPSTPDWGQHTQVHGGGVCLACLAADDDTVGYGDSVPLEMRR